MYEGDGYVIPYPDQFDYELNSLAMVNRHLHWLQCPQ